MSEELNLVRDLAVILVSAGVFAIISKALKQPLILGYIIAGFLVGPNIDFFPGISSQEAVNQWSEIGVIFLMFALGLEFSFKKLLKVGSSALVTAGTKFLGVFILGFIVGQALSWLSSQTKREASNSRECFRDWSRPCPQAKRQFCWAPATRKSSMTSKMPATL